MRGVIVKAISSFYYIRAFEASAQGAVYECRARGVFRKRGVSPLVGDIAEFDGGVINEILPRRNFFERPPAANVETLVTVMAAAEPAPSFEILDRFILKAEESDTETVICINKCELAGPGLLESFERIYGALYKLLFVSAKTGLGIDELRKAIYGKQAALAGPSGVGKSSLVNILLGAEESETGEISRKSLRGKNTTRHTELFSGDGFMLFDTPGFTSFDAELCSGAEELAGLFPEFRKYSGECRFDDCRHIKEPGCAVLEALERGDISQSRYDSYRALYTELAGKRRYQPRSGKNLSSDRA